MDEKMKAQIGYRGKEMIGILTLAGAETDTVLFQLKRIEYEDGSDASDAVLYIRVPRSGVKGDLGGFWAMYFSQPSAGENHSEWVIAHEGGSADYGQEDQMNAITAQRFKLVGLSEKDWTWRSEGSVLSLEK